MKEATGELSVTVITVVAIAAISALFVVFLLPVLRAQINLTQACTNGPGYKITLDKGKINCGPASGGTSAQGGKTWTCKYTDNDGKVHQKTCTENA